MSASTSTRFYVTAAGNFLKLGGDEPVLWGLQKDATPFETRTMAEKAADLARSGVVVEVELPSDPLERIASALERLADAVEEADRRRR
jgi:hypothetical protein